MQISKLKAESDVPYQKMYSTLFNAITAALEMIKNSELGKAQALLIRAQQETEELYMEAGTPWDAPAPPLTPAGPNASPRKAGILQGENPERAQRESDFLP